MDDEIRHLRKRASELRELAELGLASARAVAGDAESQPETHAEAVDTYIALADEVRRCVGLAHKFEREALRLERAQAARAAARPRPPRERDGHSVH